MHKGLFFLNLTTKVERIHIAKPAFLRVYAGEDVKFLLWAVKQENKRHCEIKNIVGFSFK